MNKLSDGNHPFVRRCTAALTHPVTVGALGLLLLNDLVFKALWSNPWTTGKLSDLAWVVFASPLLAFLLSPVARRGPIAGRIVFLTAYAGLPLLYAAFNTFPVVHDAILWALSFAGGTGPGAPNDPADSLMIPFGLAIAVWVWRREPPVSNSLRMRFGLLTAGVAAFASVATSPSEPVVGVTGVEVEPNGTIVQAHLGYGTSGDQGLQSVETPRGTYTIEGSSIIRTHNGQQTVAYSAAYLQERGNIELQTHATRDFGRREITSKPYSLIYDGRSGNVVVAMGLQGAVVGTPEGKWTRVAVGRYEPTDFSIVTKLLLLRDWRLWLATLSLTFSFTGLAMTLAEPGSYNATRLVMILFGLVGLVVLFGGLSFTILWIVIVGTTYFAIVFHTTSTRPWRKSDHLDTSILAILMSLVGILLFGVEDDLFAPLLSVPGSTLALLSALVVIPISYGDLRWVLSASTSPMSGNPVAVEIRKGLLPAVAASLAGMLALLSLSLLLWTQMGVDLFFTKLVAVTLCGLVALRLHRYLRNKLPGGTSYEPKEISASSSRR